MRKSYGYLDRIEARGEEFVGQLICIDEGGPLTHPEYLEDLSERTKKSDEGKIKKLSEIIKRDFQDSDFRGVITEDTIQYLSGLIELVEIPQQRQQR